MSDPYPPPDVRELLTRIETYEHLGALLLLHARSPRDWSVGEVAEHLKVSEPDAATALSELARLDLVVAVAGGGYRRVEGPPAVVDAIHRLNEIYVDDPLVVIRELTNNAIDRVRNRALRTFADAFVLRRKDG